MPVDAKYERAGYLEGIAAALAAGGRYYVMMEPSRNKAHGPFVRLNLAKAGDSVFRDTVFDHQEIEVSEGGLGYLNSKYGYLGKFETFDDLSAAQARYAEFLNEATAYRKSTRAES